MTRAMALEVAPDVRVNSVCPGYVDTDMIRRSIYKTADPAAREQMMVDYAPLKRRATTDEISHSVRYLASSDARFNTPWGPRTTACPAGGGRARLLARSEATSQNPSNTMLYRRKKA